MSDEPLSPSPLKYSRTMLVRRLGAIITQLDLLGPASKACGVSEQHKQAKAALVVLKLDTQIEGMQETDRKET